MGLPIPDGPPPELADGIGLDLGFQPSPVPVFLLCGFNFLIPGFSFAFRLPGLILPIPFPLPFPFGFALNCSLTNPLDVTFGTPAGGGRKGVVPHDPDNDYN